LGLLSCFRFSQAGFDSLKLAVSFFSDISLMLPRSISFASYILFAVVVTSRLKLNATPEQLDITRQNSKYFF
jgi:hypothetical protein